jgi:hypothetical protein
VAGDEEERLRREERRDWRLRRKRRGEIKETMEADGRWEIAFEMRRLQTRDE